MRSLHANYEASGATTLYAQAHENYFHNKHISEKVELITLDEFCKNNKINYIDFLKIDVEGHELPVLLGSSKMLENRSIKFIQFEFGPFHVYSKTFFYDFWKLLSPAYTIYRILCNGLLEIKSYSENLEIFRTADFLAELKNQVTVHNF